MSAQISEKYHAKLSEGNPKEISEDISSEISKKNPLKIYWRKPGI